MANFGSNPPGGYQFGGSAPAPNANLFGPKPAGSHPSRLFDTPANTSTGLSFGAPASSAPPNLFGTPTSTPCAQLKLFGSPAPAAGNFEGFGASPAPAFGQVTSTPAKPLFGAPATNSPATGLNFGAPASSQSTGFNLGSNAGATGFSLGGAAPSTASTGLNFGTPVASTAGTGFGFGGAPSSAANTGPPTLGAPTLGTGTTLGAAPLGGTSLGAVPLGGTSLGGTQLGGTPLGGISLGGNQLGSTSLGVAPLGGATLGGTSLGGSTLGGIPLGGATLSGTSLGSAPLGGTSLGAIPLGGTSLSTPTLGGSTLGASTLGTSTLGTISSFGGTSTAPAGLNFGLGVTSSAPNLGLNFGASTVGSTGTTAFNLGGSSSQSPFGGLGGSYKPPTTSAPVGLGGIATTQTQKPGILKNKGQADVSPKDQPLPNEIMQSVEEFKKYVKQQKTYCSEICRFSVKEFKKVEGDIDTANSLINDVEKQLQFNRQVAEKLKHDTAKALQHTEMAQRTFDTPPGLQFDNSAPLQFFIELADNFEREMQFLKTQIENTDKYLKNIGKPEALTPQDLALGMRRLHETFVALAGRLQSVHNQVESQKEQYLNLRKFMLHDNTNVFEKFTKDDKVNVVIAALDYKPPAVVTGPTPFNPLTNPNVAAQSLQATQLAQGNYPGAPSGMPPNNPPPAFGLNLNSSTNLFGSPSTAGFGQTFGSPANNSTNFQLQKPPVGNKRSK